MNFLGSSVINFTEALGWNNAESTLSVNLVDDDRCGDSFNPSGVGSPVLFDYSGHQFYGIIDKYSAEYGTAGNPTYSVQLNNGLHIFNGMEIILNDYYGVTNSVPNLVNVFGYLENASGYGGSLINDAGMSWNVIRDTLHTIVNNPSGTVYGGPISYKGFKYKIDLSALPNLPSYYRLSGNNVSLTDFVSDVCGAGGHDYFITIDPPTTGDLGVGIYGTFRVATVSRLDEPTVGAIANFINSVGCVIDKNIGVEVRRDNHSKFVVGANVERMWFSQPTGMADNLFDDNEISRAEYANDSVLPYFGLDSDNNTIIGYTPSGDPDEYYFDISIIDIGISGLGDTYTTTLSELSAAKKGYDHWEKFINDRSLNRYLIDFSGIGTTTYLGKTVPDTTTGNWRYFEDLELDGSGYSTVPKFGYLSLKNIKGIYIANTVYTVPDDPPVFDDPYFADRAALAYPHNFVDNVYFSRANKMQIVNGHGYSRARMLEYDLYPKAAYTTGVYAEQFNYIYEDFKATLGIDTYSAGMVSHKSLGSNSRERQLNTGDFTAVKVQRLYRRLKDLAENYYNKKFMVSIPFTSAAIEPESFKIRMSQTPVNEGFLDESVWAEAYTSGLIPDISGINFLTTQENKFYPFVKYENAVLTDSSGNIISVSVDLSDISDSDKFYGTPFATGSNFYYDAWVKCNVLEKIVFDDESTLFGPRAVIEVPGSVKNGQYIERAKALFFNEMKKYTKDSVVGAFSQDTAVTETWLKSRMDKVGFDEVLTHEGESIFYASLYAIPLRSNILCYGPWWAIGADGGVTYERAEDLNPWNYGGFTAMNFAGTARSADSITNQTFGETGSVTINGAPQINLGNVLISGGPYVTDIDVSVGSQGLQTTYSFQTWSSHKSITSMNNYNAKRIEKMSLKSREIRRSYREGVRNNLWKNAGQFNASIAGKLIDLTEYSRRDKPATSARILAAQDKTVVMQPTYNTSTQANTDYEDKAIMSLDGLFRPFSTVPHSSIPYYTVPEQSSVINVYDLNPISTGNNILVLTEGTGLNTGGLSFLSRNDTAPYDTGVPLNTGENGLLIARGLGLKFPMIGVGYGYTVEGTPVPADPEDETKFHPDYLINSNLHKAGPVDIRWDESRGVWTAGNIQLSHGIIMSKCSNLCNTYIVRRIRRTVNQDCESSG